MPAIADSLSVHSFSLEALGAVLAALFVVVLRPLLPASERSLLRQPLVFLLLYLAAFAAGGTLPEGSPAHRAASLLALILLLASLGRSAVLLVLDVVLGRRLRRPLPRIVRDITQGVVWVGIFLVAIRTAGVEPGSILTTSALLTAAVALSLQETLGNMVAGLAIQVQRPFDVDDWIQFDADSKHIGRVIEINWRATKVVTLDEVEVIVPNATLAKAPITNFTKPTRASRRSLYVYAPADAPPHLVQETILAALDGSIGVLKKPPSSVVTNGFIDGNVEYWVRLFTDQFDKRDAVDGAARDRIWYALRRIGLTPASATNRIVQMQEMSAAAREREHRALVERERALGNVDFLAMLSEPQLRQLAAESVAHMYVDGETVVKRGDGSTELFVVESGEVVVLLERPPPQEDLVIARLGTGKFFGEMALMTGEPRNATVRAAGACRLLGMDSRALRGLLETAPGLVEHISEVMAQRQASLADQESAFSQQEQRPSVEERRSQLLGRIRRFFSL
jgi:small-conductance mechanosensitive channel/CRP-like cAMP-binding protein